LNNLSPDIDVRNEAIVSFLRGELTESEASEFRNRLEIDPGVQSELEEFRRTVGLLESAPDAELSEDLFASILSRLSDESKVKPVPETLLWPRKLLPALRIAASFLVMCGAITVLTLRLQRVREPREDSVSGDRHESPDVVMHAAISGAADWLRANQEHDGSWSPERWDGSVEYRVALTGMSLLTLLGLPEDAGSGKTAESERQAIDYIVSNQNTAGHFGPRSRGVMYNHGIATVALIEAMDKKSEPVAPVTDAIAEALTFIAKEQLPSGGWGYIDEDGEPNTGISVWQLRALALAQQRGFLADKQPLRRGLFWLKGMIDTKGQFGYRSPTDFPEGPETLTAMGAFCLLTSEAGNSAVSDARVTLRRAMQELGEISGDDVDFYRWYFIAHAWQATDTPSDNAFTSALTAYLLGSRVQKGPHKGTWSPAGRWSTAGGRIYTTTMAALSLQACIDSQG
jgi:hypothetical protein